MLLSVTLVCLGNWVQKRAQTLPENGLRNRIVVQSDGQMKTHVTLQ
ncbi:hypothetical protein OK016_12030 [Vibrio chagasii]|nr:hypothetical protein [Vibrio chagasii]